MHREKELFFLKKYFYSLGDTDEETGSFIISSHVLHLSLVPRWLFFFFLFFSHVCLLIDSGGRIPPDVKFRLAVCFCAQMAPAVGL